MVIQESTSEYQQKVISRIFDAQDENGFWKLLPPKYKEQPEYLHYVPNFSASLWALILLADLKCDPDDDRVNASLEVMKDHFFDSTVGIYTLKEDHFPIPCLNGNMIYLDSYFNGKPEKRSLQALDFFHQYQRFDDGKYKTEKNQYCSNTSCYGKHSCYWGVVKLLKGISFIPKKERSEKIKDLLDRCIRFVLLHKVCYSSRRPDQIMIKKMDQLTFPNMYKSDFLEILWVLKREEVQSPELIPAIELLKSKQKEDGTWHLERKVYNLITSIGVLDKPNPFITDRAREVLEYYG